MGALVASLGLPCGALIATVASIGAALGTAYLLEKLRGSSDILASTRPDQTSEDDTTDDGPLAPSVENSSSPKTADTDDDGGIAALKAERDRVYIDLQQALDNGERDESRVLLRRYRQLDDQIRSQRSRTGTGQR